MESHRPATRARLNAPTGWIGPTALSPPASSAAHSVRASRSGR